ncbi:Hypothetical predicted protein [Podarcis lilfordi]|uniref:Uncharacterized protein n=1 Tax=Podarcis lilfordi TaxID=74358 RepID=A0AA35JWX2_9SAUR|nr:Hypothetical predicted protein [Podarcis lilfordi]
MAAGKREPDDSFRYQFSQENTQLPVQNRGKAGWCHALPPQQRQLSPRIVEKLAVAGSHGNSTPLQLLPVLSAVACTTYKTICSKKYDLIQ